MSPDRRRSPGPTRRCAGAAVSESINCWPARRCASAWRRRAGAPTGSGRRWSTWRCGTHLTAAQLRVLRHLAQGWTDKRIATETNVSVRTVRRHIGALMENSARTPVSRRGPLRLAEAGGIPDQLSSCPRGDHDRSHMLPAFSGGGEGRARARGTACVRVIARVRPAGQLPRVITTGINPPLAQAGPEPGGTPMMDGSTPCRFGLLMGRPVCLDIRDPPAERDPRPAHRSSLRLAEPYRGAVRSFLSPQRGAPAGQRTHPALGSGTVGP
ncbi:helix-turn-helix transcriptional regulator [Actinomadura sp. HBU206391]|nr:helix-turn-helix transcriptional regulator [Actinomadura sp. HBU206391]